MPVDRSDERRPSSGFGRGSSKCVRALAASCLAVLLFRAPLHAAEVPVDLELVLAVDISASIGGDEQRLQRQGYVSAFRSTGLSAAIRSGRYGRIAVAYVEWANPTVQKVVVPWRLLDGAAAADQFAAELAAAPLHREFDTSIANALTFSSGLFDGQGYASERRVIDISGDGPNNTGPPVLAARAAVLERGIVINGLPIMTKLSWSGGLYSIEGLDIYFEDCVIGGEGAFSLVVKHKDDFRQAIERKLLREIVRREPATIPVSDADHRQRVDCLAGEKNSGRLIQAK